VRELLSSSDNLGVTVPETVALQRLIERVDEWREKVQAVLANEGISEIHRLISTNTSCENKPTSNDGETPAPTEQSDLLSSLKNSPEFGKMHCHLSLNIVKSFAVSVLHDLLNLQSVPAPAMRHRACKPVFKDISYDFKPVFLFFYFIGQTIIISYLANCNYHQLCD